MAGHGVGAGDMSMTNANFQPRRFFKSGGTVSREQLDRLSRSANIVINGDARLSTDFGRGTKIEITGGGGSAVFSGTAYAPDGKATINLNVNSSKLFVKFDYTTWTFTEESGPMPYPWGQNEVWRRKSGLAGDLYIR